ncbi:MAG: ATPase, partial [Chloroflexi bacterium]|nr:ATPase [Chloroflexota bacterium]MCI0729086.1 ATPase [Chloroflexota bacterium]
MTEMRPLTFLCLASYFKGTTFLEEAKRQGCHVILLTREKLAGEPWPMDSVDERFLMPELNKRPDILHAVSYLARTRVIDRIVPLDDFDVETAAALREHLRVPGMGDTTARFFRDKLAMRTQARDEGILVPEFSRVLNYDELRAFMARVPPPWVLKPRSQAGAMGIKKLYTDEDLWRRLDELGDQQSYFVLEQFVPGDVYHVDSIIWEREVVFAEVHKYRRPPLAVSHEGDVFVSRTLPRDLPEVAELKALNRQLMAALRMVRGVSHTEFIQAEADGRFYFLETAARVGGANLAEMIEAATGLNLWAEWARLEVANARGAAYRLPETRQDYAGILVCLARQEWPDLSYFNDPEVVWRLEKKHHAGLIVAAAGQARVEELLDRYTPRFAA